MESTELQCSMHPKSKSILDGHKHLAFVRVYGICGYIKFRCRLGRLGCDRHYAVARHGMTGATGALDQICRG